MNRRNFTKIINDNSYKICAEIGVQNGNFSSVLLGSKLKKLYLIDCWKYLEDYDDKLNTSDTEQELRYQFVVEKFKNEPRVEIIRKLSIEACEQFDRNSLDFVYIDANHAYEFIKDDIEHWFKKVKIGGMLAGHDYLDGQKPQGNFGVKSAVDEFVIKNDLELFTTNENEWKSWYLYKI